MIAGNSKRAFTLIELLVTVAIISILSAIAVPNFLDAQIRSKVSRTKADMKTLATGLEAFAVDNNHYPEFSLFALTRPIDYISAIPTDIFRIRRSSGESPFSRAGYRYGSMPIDAPARFVLASVGPDTDIDEYLSVGAGFAPDNSALTFYPGYSNELFSEDGVVVNDARIKYIAYDPTNGAISDGDVFRLSDSQLGR